MMSLPSGGRCGILGAVLLSLPLLPAASGVAVGRERPPGIPEAHREAVLKTQGPQIDQQAKHWENQLGPILWAELDRTRRVCGDLPADARRAILDAGNKAVKATARQLAEMQFGARQQQPTDTFATLRAAVAATVKPLVSEEVFKAYEAQEAARVARSNEATIRLIVASIDERLLLNAKQRDAITADLVTGWQPAWQSYGQWVNHNPRPAPDFAAQCVTPRLDDRQKAEWKTWCEQMPANRLAVGFMWPGQSGIDVSGAQLDPWWKP